MRGRTVLSAIFEILGNFRIDIGENYFRKKIQKHSTKKKFPDVSEKFDLGDNIFKNFLHRTIKNIKNVREKVLI